MKKRVKFLCAALIVGWMVQVHGGITNGGVYSASDSYVEMEIINKSKGVIEGKRSEFLEIVNYGKVDVEDCIIDGKMTSFGELVANQTTFEDVLIGGGEAWLISCRLENLIISDHPEGDSGAFPQVVLSGDTLVKGSIVFETDQGVVYKGPEVVILGEIVDGVVLDLQE